MANKRIIRLVSVPLMVLFIYSPCTALDFEESQIQSISKGIEKGRENDREVEFCSSFSLNKRQVVKYFKRAKTVQKGWPSHDLDWVACFVEGTIKNEGRADQVAD